MLKLAGTLFQPDDTEPDVAAHRRILHRIRKQIDQNLIDPCLVSQQVFMLHAGHCHMELLLSGLSHRPDDRIYGGHHII